MNDTTRKLADETLKNVNRYLKIISTALQQDEITRNYNAFDLLVALETFKQLLLDEHVRDRPDAWRNELENSVDAAANLFYKAANHLDN
jgi:hypothetical protein